MNRQQFGAGFSLRPPLTAAWVLCLVAAALAAPGRGLAAEPGEFRTKFDRDIATSRPTLVCTRVEKGPAIDGEVDKDPVWASCGRTHGAWTQLARKEVSGRQTVTYCCYDKENLYFAFVCEEPDLQNVRMDGVLAESFQPAGPDDSVEAILEVGGVQGDGEVFSFRANSRAHSATSGVASIPADPGDKVPAWKSAGKFGPKRWMLEMAIPFTMLERTPSRRVLFPTKGVPRGYVLGLKLVRWGAQQQDPKNRMVSTWNSDIAFGTPYIAGSDGLLYFEDSNSLRDGDFAMAAKDSPWQRKGQIESDGKHGLSMGKDASVTQTMDVYPGSFYTLSVKSEGPIEALLDGKKVAIKDGRASFWTGDEQDKASLTLRAAELARVKEAILQYEPGEKRPGPYCLTNNYRHADRNIRALVPDAPEGKYQYILLDYQNRTIGDGNPAISLNHWAYDYNLRVEDLGGKKGWIPFGKGSLTGRPEPVFWQTANPSDYATWGRQSRVVEVDLGQAYFVRGLDVLWPAPNIINLEIWGKLKAEDDWALLHMSNGTFVAPAKRNGERHSYESVMGLDSVVRHLMWRVSQPTGERVWPQMDGIQEFWVWGEPAGAHKGIKPFAPWVPNEGAPPKKWTTTTPDPDICQILPRPRKMTKVDGWFVIGPKTRIVAQGDPEARKVAKQIREEIHERWQVDLAVEEEPADAAAKLDDVIYVGQPRLSRLAEALRVAEGLDIQPGKPQAYALRASQPRVVVLGADSDGLYWGVQSLMLAMRWHTSRDPKQNGLGVHCMKVEDWPATLDRSEFYAEGTLFSAIEDEIPRIVSNARLHSRFKWNAVYTAVTDPPIPWQATGVAAVCRQIREQHHMEARPMLMEPPSYYLGGWNKIAAAAHDFSVVERDPDESPEELGGALNLCPLNARTYALINTRVDEMLEQYGWPSKIWMGGLVNHAPEKGSRWAVCRDCMKSGKSSDELFAYFADQLARHLSQRHATGVVEPHDVAFGDRQDSRWKRAIVAADIQALPGDLEYILPAGFSPGNSQALKARLRPALTCGGATDWPSAERISWAIGSTAAVEAMWRGPDMPPATEVDSLDLNVWMNCWHFHRDLPSWRAGDRPGFFSIDLRPFVNHAGDATGTETLEPGRAPAMDLRYVPKGKLTLSGVDFDLIDPVKNNGKSVLMLGRPIPGATHAKDASTIAETAGPIPVGRKLASLVFLRAGWQASTQDFGRDHKWLFPCCRVIYEDGTWLPVDCFRVWAEWDTWTSGSTYGAGGADLIERPGWIGNCPGGSDVHLRVGEWVNPYPEKTVKCLNFVTPGYEEGEGSKRVNPQVQAFVAITGVEPIEQDFKYWSKRTDRLPLLPPTRPPQREGVVIKRLSEQYPAGGVSLRMKGPAGELTSSLDITPGAGYTPEYTSSLDCGKLLCNTNYKPFGVVQTLEPAARLCRVDVRGPNYGVDHEYSIGRSHRLDVTVEISEDGKTWRKVGDLKGISGDADFQPVEFEPALVKKLRFTATAGPYHEEYNPAMAWVLPYLSAFDYPYFVWRLLAPAEAPGPKKS